MTNKTKDAQTLARKLYEAHAKFHGFSGERWNDEPWQSRHSWLNIAKTAIEALQPADTITRLQAALTDARGAIASLDREALGMGTVAPEHDGATGYLYPIRDELLAKIDAALSVGGE